MKQLQNNFTTPEQSKRLLELGVPADSADMYYCKLHTETFWSLNVISGATYTSMSTPLYDFMFVPCWSVGRLIEISIICGIGDRVPNELYINKYSLDPSLVENIIHRLERVADLSVNDIDFSILED